VRPHPCSDPSSGVAFKRYDCLVAIELRHGPNRYACTEPGCGSWFKGNTCLWQHVR